MASERKRGGLPSPEKGLLLILSGPSGVGKGTVCRRLLELTPGLSLSVSTTTRLPRPGEIDGRHYYFVTAREFKAMIEADEFLEWAEVHGHKYGTRLRDVENVLQVGSGLILEIDVQGAALVRAKAPAAVSVFLAPPSKEALRERITGRGTEEPELIRHRLETARREMAAFGAYDYLVVNDTVEEAAREVRAIIIAERCRVARGARPPAWGGEQQ